jgi:hypothetical protein
MTVTNDLAEDSNDEKRINRAERAAERKLKKMKRKSAISASLRPLLGGDNAPQSNRIGPCYKLSNSYHFCSCTTHFSDFFVPASIVNAAINAKCFQQHHVCMCYFIGGKLPQLFGDLFRPSEIK